MAEKKQSEDVDPARQVRQHLASLKASGVEWLPKAAAPPTAECTEPPPDPPAALASSPAVPTPQEHRGITPDQRQRELTVLAARVSGCSRCSELASTRTQTVFGVGPVGAELCFVGEAPGADEDAQGEPFVGAAGQLLNRIIVACGFKREEVYICNILRCRPPGNRQPLPNEAANCREFLDRQLELVAPKYICCLGATAAQNLLQSTESIGRLRGRFIEFRGMTVMCTYHPAYLLRTPEKKKDVWEDMQRLLAKMGRPVPK